MKRAGVPVLLNVETIFEAMLALLPIPVIMTLPEAEKMVSTASEKLELRRFSRFSIAFFSSAITCIAIFCSSSLDFCITFFLPIKEILLTLDCKITCFFEL